MTGLGYKKILTRRSSNLVHYLSPPAGKNPAMKPFFSLSVLFYLLDLLRLSRLSRVNISLKFLSILSYCPRLKKALCEMFMPFYYYQNSKCLGRAVRGAEKDLNLALIGYCGYFHFSLW